MADVIYSLFNRILKKRTDKNINIALLSHIRYRSTISKGNTTSKTACQLMPFNNSIAVISPKVTQINALLMIF